MVPPDPPSYHTYGCQVQDQVGRKDDVKEGMPNEGYHTIFSPMLSQMFPHEINSSIVNWFVNCLLGEIVNLSRSPV